MRCHLQKEREEQRISGATCRVAAARLHHLIVLGCCHHGLHRPSSTHSPQLQHHHGLCRKLTKLARFVPNTTSATAVDVAHQFFNNTFKLHGLPTSIISDRDTRFTSRYGQQLHKLLDVKLALSSAYHLQTDGQTEVMNKTLKTMLRAFVDNKQSNWDQLLPSLEFAYSNYQRFHWLLSVLPRHWSTPSSPNSASQCAEQASPHRRQFSHGAGHNAHPCPRCTPVRSESPGICLRMLGCALLMTMAAVMTTAQKSRRANLSFQ
ncbi:hypothetical protein EMPS_07773 [Entomortierella parvispora]|uniref:Integrase catalytic domain-containing protein n=1 Tax=Entomortierella parvispora TaxID=205924 RepID=A0A9P3LZ02_9FUNG|nr:hypothetical protein EMPS_07773 [Entomortierella parvispora]